MLHMGHKGQAVIRGLNNAYGFPTKWLPRTIPEAYFNDGDPEVELLITKHLTEIEIMLVKGKKIWWPSSGVGTGLAKWQKYAPMTLQRVNNIIRHWVAFYH